MFNGASYIQDAVESVLSQTFEDFEIIIVDDGSTDNTRAILEPWIQEKRICYTYQKNKGLAGARNTGIRMAKGEFLKFLDCDDLLYPQQLEIQVRHLENKPENIISVTNYELEFEGKGKKNVEVKFWRKNQLASFIEGNPCPIHTILVRRNILELRGGFDEKLLSHEDTDLWLQILISGGIFEKVDYVGCLYRIRQNSLSANMDKMFEYQCQVYEKLNSTLLTKLNQMPEEVLFQLVLSNTKLIYICFARKIEPLSCIPITLQNTRKLYQMKMSMPKSFLLTILDIRNYLRIKYTVKCLINRHYSVSLLKTNWRND